MNKKARAWIWIIVALAVIALIILGLRLFSNTNSNDKSGSIIKPVETLDNSAEISDTSGSGNDQPLSSVPSTQPKTYNADIKNFAYSPSTLTVKKGDTIIWTNQDTTKHTVTSDSGSELDSELLGKGETYSHTFSTEGTFAYHCTPHPYMKAKIIVE